MLQDMTIRELTKRLASGNPPPGGGSTVALNAMLGIAAMQMAVQSDDKLPLQRLCEQLGLAAERDAAALEQLLAESRRAALSQSAVVEAAQAPLAIARCCLTALEAGQVLGGRLKEHAIGDFLAGILAVRAALQGSLVVIAMNIPLLHDLTAADEFKLEIKELETRTEQLVTSIRQQLPLYESL